MISTEQRTYINTLHEFSVWRGNSMYARYPVRRFSVGSVYLHGWRTHRIWRTATTPSMTSMLARNSDKPEEITSVLSIILWEAATIEAAHDHLMDVLADMQSTAITRNRQREIGDVLFTLADTMFLFARSNLVVLVRNAGPTVLSLGEVAGTIDFAIVRHLEKNGAPPLSGSSSSPTS
jgi:hypothetical protein